MASVSVGKPAMMSAPNTMSGRSRRTCVAERDRVGAQMPALHALEDQVVAGLQRQMQMRHQPGSLASASSRSASASTESIEESRSRASSGTSRRMCLTSVPSRAAVGA